MRNELTISRPDLLEDGSDRKFRELLYMIFAYADHLEIARGRFAARIGLSPTQYMALIAIARLEDSAAGIAQIAQHLHFSGAFVTIEVNKLVKLGLMEKRPNPADGRRVILRCTPKAHDTLAELAALQRPINDALFRSLGKEDFLALHRILSALTADAEGALALSDYLAETMELPGKVKSRR